MQKLAHTNPEHELVQQQQQQQQEDLNRHDSQIYRDFARSATGRISGSGKKARLSTESSKSHTSELNVYSHTIEPKTSWKGAALVCENVTFSTTSPTGETTTLLHNVSCQADYGKLTAVMGPSGAGKSTLLHVMGGRRRDGNYEGRITLDGRNIEDRGVVFGIRYVRQFPLIGHPQQPSIRNLLLYGHRYGVGGNLTSAPHMERDRLYKRAALLVNIFKMNKFITRDIGMLSGGQQKLLRVAQVFLLDPKVILLDEPTSGLDALSSEILIHGLKLAAKIMGCCICVVIHQPAESLFQEFDEIICLKRGGMAFQGPYQDVKDCVLHKVETVLCKPLGERTFPDWMLDLAANHPEISYTAPRVNIAQGCVEDVKFPSRSPVSFSGFLGNVITYLNFYGYNPLEAALVIAGCLTYAALVFRPICEENGWMPRHDIFRVTITGFVVGLHASRVLPLLYLELSLQINDIVDGIIHPITMYLSLLYFTTVFCTYMGVVNTLFMNVILPAVAGITDPFGTESISGTGLNGASLQKIGDAHALSAAFMLNIVMSNVFGLLGLFILCAMSDFKRFLPISKGTLVAFYLTAVLATCSLFGGTVYSLKESVIFMEYFLYLSPNFWYTQGSLLAWVVGREYKQVDGGNCGTTGEEQRSMLPYDVCGDTVFEALYGSNKADQGFPLLALFIISMILVLLSLLAFLINTKHRHSKREGKELELAVEEDLGEIEQEAMDYKTLLEINNMDDVRDRFVMRMNNSKHARRTRAPKKSLGNDEFL